MYNSILIFITALFLFNASLPGTVPSFSFWLLLPLTLSLVGGFYIVAKLSFRHLLQRGMPYQKLETLLSILALAVFEVVIICWQPGYYLATIPFARSITALQSAGGITIFLALLTIVWLAGHNAVSAKSSAQKMIIDNLQTNLPVILPWLLVTLLYDIINIQPFAALRSIADSPYGIVPLIIVVLLVLPDITRRIWGCYKMPAGKQRQDLTAFCKQLHFSAELYIWPLHGGRAITAAVVGLIPGFRYILLTPALLETMDEEEIKAVIAHETGHVKRWHLLLSILLIAGFGVFTSAVMEPVVRYLDQLHFPAEALSALGLSQDAVAAILSSAPALIAMLLFFRFVFGYFIRNFEREADLYSYTALGSAAPLISAFDKLARYGSAKKEEKNWHHFGLGERIQFLHNAEHIPDTVNAHSRKLRISLAGYFLLTAALIFSGTTEPPSPSRQLTLEQLTLTDRALVREKLERLSIQQKAAWYRQLGDILIRKRYERDGLASYERSLQLDPYNPITLNNLAWLLIASDDLALRDPERALDLALEATLQQQDGAFYDTLAAVYWANGMAKEALKAEEKAMALDPGRKQYYERQAWKFNTKNYKEGVSSPQQSDTIEPPQYDIPQLKLPNTEER